MRVVRCKRCFNPCSVKVSSRGTVSACCDSSVYLVEEPLSPEKDLLWERIGNGIAAIILVCAFCLIAWMLIKVFTAEKPIPTKFRQIVIERSLTTLGVRPESVEIYPDGRLFYILAGKRYEIKE